MKLSLLRNYLLPAFFVLLLLPLQADAEWILYDDFNSGQIDESKWIIDSSSASISVENGQAKFIHQVGHPGDFSMLLFKQCPDQITAIKVKIRIESCTGDVCTRTGGWAGEDANGVLIWQNILLDPKYNQIHPYVHGVTRGTYIKAYELYSDFYRHPGSIIGNDFVVEVYFNLKQFKFNVENLGTILFEPEDVLLPPTDLFEKHIGTKSDNGEGPCTVYFDDIYIQRDGVCNE